MITRMQQRRGTAAQWDDANTVLASGEIGVNTDNNQFKLGDGFSNWGQLEYFQNFTQLGETYATISDLEAVIGLAPETLDTLSELADAINNDPDFFNTIQADIDSKVAKDELVLGDINDVQVSDVFGGQALVYDAVSGNWVPGELTSSLAELTDVDVTTVVDKNALVYSEELGLWIPGESGGKFTISETPPADSENGDTWFDSTTGKSYIYYSDYDNDQWVEIGAQPAGYLGLNELNDVNTSGVLDGNALVYDAVQGKWVPGEGGGGASFSISDTAPATPEAGDVWFNSSTGKTYIYYTDADTSQWVEIASQTTGFGSIDELSDVDTTGVADGDALVYDTAANSWVPGSVAIDSLNDIADVNITAPADGQALVYDSSSGDWVNETPATTIDSLTDTTITTPSDEDILRYDSGTSKWVNETAGYVDQTNGTVTTASTSLGVVRNIYTSTSTPSGGMDGDIWIVYS